MTNNVLTDAQLLFRLQDFYGAEQDASKIGDHEYAQECADVVSIIRELQERRKAEQDSEPVAYISDCGDIIGGSSPFFEDYKNLQPLYRHAQPFTNTERQELESYRTAKPIGYADKYGYDTYTGTEPMKVFGFVPTLTVSKHLPKADDIAIYAVSQPALNNSVRCILPDDVFHMLAVRWPLSAEQIKRLCRELQLEMEKHQ